jgi:RND superfamily putative drug exporter
MLNRLAGIGIRTPRRTLAAAGVVLVVAGVLGAPVPGLLNARNDFEDPGSQSARGRTQIERATHAEPFPELLALVSAPSSSPATLAVAATLRSDAQLASVAAPVASRDGSSSMVAATLRTGELRNDVVKRLQRAFAGEDSVMLGGSAVAHYELGKQASSDLGFAELLAFPLLAILAFVIFRGVAALLPLAVGATSVLVALALLRAINAALPLSVFALNVVIGLGLGLAVDYSLFMVSRFREELASGAARDEAVRTTMRTAGRTVLFSSLTVAVALSSLVVFPLRFLQSMGIGGAAVALVAAAVSLSVLPALFVLLGDRLGRTVPGPVEQGYWYRLTRRVLRRPGVVAVTTTLALLALATPALRVHWAGVDASALPASKSARVVADTLARRFPALAASPAVVALHAGAGTRPLVDRYASRLATVANVRAVAPPRRLDADTWSISLALAGPAIGDRAQRAIADVRSVPAPYPAAVTGDAAEFADQRAAIAASLPLALAVLVVGTLLILWLLTGSVVLPVKALAMNALTVGAATGLLVLVFQDGRLTGLLDYTSQGGLEQSDFLVLAAIAFALSTDYGVFVLTRIKEAHDLGADNREAIAVGLQRSGRIVTAAAILLSVAIGAFASSQIVFLKEIGLGAVAAVLIDAFIVRSLLVPSLMGLLGPWNWWSPSPLRRLHERLAVHERGAVAAGATGAAGS